MTKKLSMAVFAAVFFAKICTAQSSSSQSVTNWGESVNGVQLSISLNTNVLIVGSSTTVQCWVKNSSTNIIGWGVTEATQGFVVFLTNSAGNLYRLTPEPDTNSEIISVTYALFYRMGAGETHECSVPISISKEIKPGNYQIEAKQYFSIFRKRPRQEYELVSNLLEVKIK
jgi:hypothetical protein